MTKAEFLEELGDLINRYSVEDDSSRPRLQGNTPKSIAHVVGETIVGTSPIGSEHLCQGKCEYSPGLIRLDEIRINW